MSQWSEPVQFSDTNCPSEARWSLTAIFHMSSPEFDIATEASVIESALVTDRQFRYATPSDLDVVADLEKRLDTFSGQPLAALADFLASGSVAGNVNIPLHGGKPIYDALTRRVLAKQKAVRTAEQDAHDFGIGFEVDGKRVAPNRVRVFKRSEPQN